MQRVFIIHGWGGSPNNDWMPWAKKSLEDNGYEVFVPVMPETENPKIEPWLNKMSETIGTSRQDDIFVGHSIGCLAIIRYLQTLSDGQKVGKVILVAPWQYLTLDENEDPEIAKPWIETPIDYEKVKSKADRFTAVFSDDDPCVPYNQNVEFFKEKLNPEIITKNKMGHFNMPEIPFLLELLK